MSWSCFVGHLIRAGSLTISGAFATIDKIQLLIPQYVKMGEDVALACEHSVSPEQLYQVEWHKNRKKIFQYVKGRNPPFRYFHMEGAVVNVRIAIFFYKISQPVPIKD